MPDDASTILSDLGASKMQSVETQSVGESSLKDYIS